MNVLITGAAQGLGKLIAEHLLDRGHSLFVMDRLPLRTLDERYAGRLGRYCEVDLSDHARVQSVVNELLAGHSGIDVLINNAARREFKEFGLFDRDEIRSVISTNFESVLLLTHAVLPRMVERNFGRIISISSTSALRGYAAGSIYASTKSSLITFTESIASEFVASSRNITANVLLPDSFQKVDGKRLKAYDYIVNRILLLVDGMMRGNANGRSIVVATPMKRLLESLKAHVHLQRMFL